MKKKRVLVPLLYDYYLFDYLASLSQALQSRGYEVNLITADKVVLEKYAKMDIKSSYAPLIIRLLLRRSGNIFIRSLLWVSGHLWITLIKHRYDFSIVPWDNKPLWYLISRKIPSLTVHNTTNLMGIDLEIDANKSNKNHPIANYIENKLKVRLLPRLCNIVLKHNKFWYLDRLFGMRSDSLIQGFSGIDYMSVTGNKIKDTLSGAGLSKKGTRIHVVGNPAYDGFINFSSKFTNDKKIAYKKHLNLSESKDLYALFLSPSSFSEGQVKEVMLVVETVLTYDGDASILVKFHPKTEAKYIDIFRSLISRATSNYSILTGNTGDYVNLNIILSSKCILQKQSTVGYISMLVSKPIISYNFMDTDYSDDMYKVMKSSLHCESVDDMLNSLSKLNSEDEMQKLQKLQDIACTNFCKRTNSATSDIVDIIDDHFSNQH